MGNKKQLFKGMFNWYGEVHTLYTQAYNKDRALNNFTVQLAKTLKVSRGSVYFYFTDGRIDNYKIVIEGE